MKHTKKETQQITYHTCDFCHKKASTYLGIKIYSCHGCDCDICGECGNWWMNDPWRSGENDDYPPIACDRCHELMQPLAEKARKLQETYDDVIGELICQWEEACKHAT